jgi:ferredoxin--NADP+ reductase
MAPLGTTCNPLRVAIIGSGPSGFYAAEALLDTGLTVEIDIFEKLPVPFGLVRFGVAPDHAKLKSVCAIFDGIAHRTQVRFFGNVALGADLSVDDFQNNYHATIVATGASGERKLGVHGEDRVGVHSAGTFVGWYNGHPDHCASDFDLSQEVAVVIGQGNVAIDVCRVLAKSVEELKHTDIANHALDALTSSRIREIHLIGRRGPVQAKFTPKELRELGALPGWRPIVDPDALRLNAASVAELQDPSRTNSIKNMKILQDFAARPDRGEKKIFLHFQLAPTAIHGNPRVDLIEFEKQTLDGPPFQQVVTPAGQYLSLPGGLLFRSVGYQANPLPGLPFDERKGVIPNHAGQILDASANIMPGWYVCGWIKRGPTGIIGTNRACSIETVERLLGDLPMLQRPRSGRRGIMEILQRGSTRIIDFDDWKAISAAETQRGAERNKVSEKFISITDMLDAAAADPHSQVSDLSSDDLRVSL